MEPSDHVYLSGWVVLGSVGGNFQPILMSSRGRLACACISYEVRLRGGKKQGLEWELIPSMPGLWGLGPRPKLPEESNP